MNPVDDKLIRDADLLDGLAAFDRGQRFGKPGSRDIYVWQLIEEQQQRDARAAERAALPRDQRRRAVIREVFENEGPSPENLRFMHSVLAICGLPYRQLPEGVHEFERTQGRMGLVVTAGKLRAPDGSRIQQPVPYGPKARLLLAHLTTQAILTQSPEIELADTLTGFLRDLGFPATGGKAGTLHAFKTQLNALFACHMEISSWDGHKATTIKAEPFDSVEVFFSDNPDQRSLWASTICFSDKMFAGLIKHAIPMDIRALRAFQGSARKLDMLFWLGYRLHSMRAPLTITYKALAEQFGEGYGRQIDFQRALARDVAHLKEVFPKLPIKLTEQGMTIENADPSVLMLPSPTKARKR